MNEQDRPDMIVQSVDEWRKPSWWPYADLPLRAPFCAICGEFPMMMVAPGVHPMAFCQTDGCPAFTWDPTRTYADAMAEWLTPEIRRKIGQRWLTPPYGEA